MGCFPTVTVDAPPTEQINKQTNILKHKPHLYHLYRRRFSVSASSSVDCPSVRLSVLPRSRRPHPQALVLAHRLAVVGARAAACYTSRLEQSGSGGGSCCSSHLQRQPGTRRRCRVPTVCTRADLHTRGSSEPAGATPHLSRTFLNFDSVFQATVRGE